MKNKRLLQITLVFFVLLIGWNVVAQDDFVGEDVILYTASDPADPTFYQLFTVSPQTQEVLQITNDDLQYFDGRIMADGQVLMMGADADYVQTITQILNGADGTLQLMGDFEVWFGDIRQDGTLVTVDPLDEQQLLFINVDGTPIENSFRLENATIEGLNWAFAGGLVGISGRVWDAQGSYQAGDIMGNWSTSSPTSAYIGVYDPSLQSFQIIRELNENASLMFAFSPIANQVVYSDYVTDAETPVERLFLYDMDLGLSRQLTPSDVDANCWHLYPQWSPDATQIVFSRVCQDVLNFGDLVTIDVNTGDMFPLTFTPDIDEYPLDWGKVARP